MFCVCVCVLSSSYLKFLLLAIWDRFVRVCHVFFFFACIPSQQRLTRKKPRIICENSLSECFTFRGDAGVRLGSGGRVPVSRGFSAPGCGLGDQRGGEGVDVRGVGDVAQLILCLGKKTELV